MSKLKILLVLIIFVASTSICYGKEEWKEKGFDFKKIKTILLVPTVSVSEDNQYVDKESISRLFSENILKAENMRVIFVTYRELEIAAGESIHENMQALKNTDDQRYQEIMNTYITTRVDGILKVNISNLQSNTTYIQPRTETQTYYQQEVQYTQSYDPYTRQTRSIPTYVNVPYTTTVHFPGYYATYSYGTAEFSLTTLKDGQERWRFSDSSSMEAGNGAPLNVVAKIFKDGMGKLRKITGKVDYTPEPFILLNSDEVKYTNPRRNIEIQ